MKLGAAEGVLVDQGLEVARGVEIPLLDPDPPEVDRVVQDLVEHRQGDRLAPPAAESPHPHLVEDVRQLAESGGGQLERLADERRDLRVRLDGLRPVGLERLAIAERSGEGPPPLLGRGLHAGERPIPPQVVVELAEGREDPVHQLAGRRVVDRLGDRAQRDPQLHQVRLQGVVVVLVPREAVQHVDHQELHVALALPAEGEHPLQLGPVLRPGGFAPLDEDLRHFQASDPAELDAGLSLSLEAQVLELLVARHPAVDDGSHLASPPTGRSPGSTSAPARRCPSRSPSRRPRSRRRNPATPRPRRPSTGRRHRGSRDIWLRSAFYSGSSTGQHSLSVGRSCPPADGPTLPAKGGLFRLCQQL